jgi:hypothetical protein
VECSRFWGPNLLAAAPKARVNPNPAANPKVPKPTLATPEGIMQAAKMASFKALLNGPSDAIDVYLVPTKRAETATQSTAGTQASVEAPSQQGNSAPKESVSRPGNAIGPSANVQPPLVAGQTPQGQPPVQARSHSCCRNQNSGHGLAQPADRCAACRSAYHAQRGGVAIHSSWNAVDCAFLKAARSASWPRRQDVGAQAAGQDRDPTNPRYDPRFEDPRHTAWAKLKRRWPYARGGAVLLSPAPCSATKGLSAFVG